MTRFGSFQPLCTDVPSYPWCNLFYRQLRDQVPQFPLANPSIAPVGINPICGIPRAGTPGHLGNIANIALCALCTFLVAGLIVLCYRRKAAVGRIEIMTLLSLYFVSLPLQLLTTGSFLRQGSTALSVFTALHAGVVAALFAALLGNAIVSTQVVEDGTLFSIIPLAFLCVVFFTATTYISLDTAFHITSRFGPSNPPQEIISVPIFVLTSLWPLVVIVLYLLVMTYIVVGPLGELRPLRWFYGAAIVFVLAQLDYFLLSKPICLGTNQRLDGSFIATFLETAAVGLLIMAWRAITEETWEDGAYPP